MTAKLVKSVVTGGVVYPAGTLETDELRERIPAEFWDGKPANEVPAKSAPRKSTKTQTGN